MTDRPISKHPALGAPYKPSDKPQIEDPYAHFAQHATTAPRDQYADREIKPYGQGEQPPNYLGSGAYMADVARNCDPNAYHPHLVDLATFLDIARTFAEAGDVLDKVKKTLIYGKDPTYPVRPQDEDDMAMLSDSEEFNSIPAGIVHAIVGMATETAEMIQALLNTIEDGKPFDMTNFVEEMGDELWYKTLGAMASGKTLDQIAWINTKKLAVRYPDKFTSEAALNRNLHGERAVLEAGNRIDVV